MVKSEYTYCPECGARTFNGYECFDCGWNIGRIK